jgi:hypothetical protein
VAWIEARIEAWIGPGLLALAALVWAGWPPGATPAPVALDPETERLLVESVEAAAALDYYDSRCRSDLSGRHTDNLNKELVEKLRITVLAVQDEHFPERGFRAVQARLQAEQHEALRQAGGCKGAKESGLPERLRERYRGLLESIEGLP